MNEADNLARLKTHFDYQHLQIEKQLDQAKSDEEIGRQKLLRNFSIFGFLLMLITGGVIYRSYRIKKKDNKLLLDQKRSVETLSKQVHEADQAKLQFYTNVSHELRTPLTLILGMTEKLKSMLHNDPNLALIRKNSYKLLHLINHLLDLRKLDASKMKLSVQMCNINDFIKGIIGSFVEHAKQKQISIVFHEDCNIKGYIDWDKVEKIFANLVSNAIKYTPNGGSIEVIIGKSESGFLKLEIRDNGIGIPDHEVYKIFKRFYRVAESDHNGSGIGLALVKELVDLHKGEISVDTLKGAGTSFTVSLPIEGHFYSDDEIEEKAHHGIPGDYSAMLEEDWGDEQEIVNTSPDPDKKSVLIVEDNKDLRKYITEIFRDHYEILEAENGMAGLKLACEYVPDIIISDILMPKMSGIQLVEKLKSINSTSHIPIVLLTAKDDLGSRLSGFEKGADDYICKPFESAILKSRVENLLRLRNHLVEKFSKQFHLQPREITIDDAEQKFLQKTIDLIENHISDPDLNIDLLAVELGISRTQLYRKLKALTDYSANRFIRIIRLQRAAQILKHGQNNIAEVMDATGFSNYSYFNNCFKEYFGEYPKDYALLESKGSLN
jgi:signal transduction histidine kinase/DNA-binding response OmpR family regulator